MALLSFIRNLDKANKLAGGYQRHLKWALAILSAILEMGPCNVIDDSWDAFEILSMVLDRRILGVRRFESCILPFTW